MCTCADFAHDITFLSAYERWRSFSSGALTFLTNAPVQMPMGNNSAVATLEELLAVADFVTLHVPLSDATTRMIGAAQLQHMRKGR